MNRHLPENSNDTGMKAGSMHRELTAADLRFELDGGTNFQSTQEWISRDDFAGQERAVSALEMALEIKGSGYNVFASGLSGATKLQDLERWIKRRVARAPTPGDWVYVHNFDHPDAPRAIYLQAGKGKRLSERMAELVRSLKEDLPKAFRQEAFNREKSLLRQNYATQTQEESSRFERLAREKGFQIQPTSDGNVMFIPLIDGKPMENPEELSRLSQEEQEQITKRQQELVGEMEQIARKQTEITKQLRAEIKQIEQRFCEQLLSPRLAAIDREIENEAVSSYLAQVKKHILEHLDDFKEQRQQQQPMPFMPEAMQRDPETFFEYEVNPVVDNSETRAAPVVVEASPTYLNLFGTIERVVDRSGRLVTNFTRIKAGSILRAHGGYLILNLEDAITEPAVWKVLKRVLRSGRIEMETYEPFALFSATGLRPEPIQVDVKLVVVGNPYLYHLLYTLDSEFHELFKVKADFRESMELDSKHVETYASWVGRLCEAEQLPHFDASAVARLVQFGARETGDREKVVASYSEIEDLVREAAFWARKEDGQMTSARHVESALNDRIFRSNRIEEEIRDLIAKGTILIDIDGRKIGQVNGLSVMEIGGYSFGRPSRVTASVALGQSGILNIERESRLSGRIHDKGVLIIAGYLRNRYGRDKPLALSASICFEQSYSGIEGDSASSAELYALLSHLADLPLRQDVAVTGSVNQWGEIQAIGGVNEKIEGFFDICRLEGLTGRQGVMIPEANIRNLVLRSDIIQAVDDGQFHIYPVCTIDEGLEVLSGRAMGEEEEQGTINAAVGNRLLEMAVALKSFNQQSTGASPPPLAHAEPGQLGAYKSR